MKILTFVQANSASKSNILMDPHGIETFYNDVSLHARVLKQTPPYKIQFKIKTYIEKYLLTGIFPVQLSLRIVETSWSKLSKLAISMGSWGM